jgi:hypothetical protein
MGNTCLGFGFRGGLRADDVADLMQVRIHIGVDKILPSIYNVLRSIFTPVVFLPCNLRRVREG